MISSRTRFYIEKIRDRFFFKKKGTVLVVCWSMSHNPLGRAFLFWDFLRRDYRTKIVGPIFNKFGKKIWLPLRRYLKGADTFTGSNFPEFLDQAKDFAKKQKAVDIIVICKPRLPSMLIGLLVAQKNNAKVILDIDDYELAFFESQEPLKLEDAIQQGLDLSNPYHETWTRICHTWIKDFPNRVVSNHKLQQKYGGVIIPHVRNERIFNPKLYNRSKIRKRHGYNDQDKVILFLGTPREHKGFEEIPKTLKEIGNPNYKFCLIGKIRNDELRDRFHREYGNFAQSFNDSDFRDLPEKLCIADLICLLQDQDSLVSEYQMPAKLMDAISMEIPVLTTPVGPLKEFCEKGITFPILSTNELPSQIENILDQKSTKLHNHRKTFLEMFSYEYGNKTMEGLLNNDLHQNSNEISKVLKSIKALSKSIV